MGIIEYNPTHIIEVDTKECLVVMDFYLQELLQPFIVVENSLKAR